MIDLIKIEYIFICIIHYYFIITVAILAQADLATFVRHLSSLFARRYEDGVQDDTVIATSSYLKQPSAPGLQAVVHSRTKHDSLCLV